MEALQEDSAECVSLTGRVWRLRAADARKVAALQHAQPLPEVVARIMAARGIEAEQVHDFLHPTLRGSLPDPSHLLDMDIAAERLAGAVISGEKIAVFGDYDVDGATSAALLVLCLRALGCQPITYIPDRMVEGYGPNINAFQSLKAQGASVVLTVDCGTLSFEPLEAAHNAGLDVIVVDHHQGEARKPKAFAIINPNRLDETSPHGTLAAVGVVFLLLVALNRALRMAGWFATRQEPDIRQWLDIVALGTICDVVPLVGLNRAFVAQGIKIMAARRNLGLRTLMDVAQVHEVPGVYHVGFMLGPRINAGGRVGKADLGVKLLTSEDEAEALCIAQELDRLNGERRILESSVQEQALQQAESKDANSPVLVVADQGWHAGVIGIVAGRLKERFHKPVAVISLEGSVGKASARSVPGFDFGAAVIAAFEAGLLVAGGGHAMAAGFTVKAEKIADLEAFLSARVLQPEHLYAASRVLHIDAVLSIGGVNEQLVRQLERMGPFGQGNPPVRVIIEGVTNISPQLVAGQHVKTWLGDPLSRQRLSAIAFRSMGTPLGDALLEGKGAKFNVAGQLRMQEWNGSHNISVMIDDVARA